MAQNNNNAANNNANLILKNLAAPNFDNQPLCIRYPKLDVALELRSGLIQLLPKFHGLIGEDPHKHLKEFHVVCSMMKPAGVTEEHIKLRAFPFSLDSSAKDWLYYLPSGCIDSWVGMQRLFLEKFFPATRTINLRKEICGIMQMVGETLSEYLYRFKKLCQLCPHHQYTEVQLILYFYEGMQVMDRAMLDAASGGALADKTPADAWRLIDTIAVNSQQFGTRQDVGIKRVNEVGTSHLEQQLVATNQQLSQLTTLMMIQLNMQQPKKCDLCASNSHYTDHCLSLLHGQLEEAHVVGFLSSSYPNTYNQLWKNQSNFNYENSSRPPFQPQPSYMPRPETSQSTMPGQTSNAALEVMMQKLVDGQLRLEQEKLKFEQETRAGMQDMRNQIGQLATSLNRIESQLSNKLPSQPINPKESVNAITLHSSRTLEEPRTETMQSKVADDRSPSNPKNGSKGADVKMVDAFSTDGKKSGQKTPVTPKAESQGSKILFMGNLSWSIEQADVENFFKDCGEVKDVCFAAHPDGTFKGYGHVEFTTPEAAAKALELNGQQLLGRDVKLDLAKERGAYTPNSGKFDNSFLKRSGGESTTVFVKGFDKNDTEDKIRSALEDHFGSCGEIKGTRLPTDLEGYLKGMAYIEFTDGDAMNKALELNNSQIGNRTLYVDDAKPRGDSSWWR